VSISRFARTSFSLSLLIVAIAAANAIYSSTAKGQTPSESSQEKEKSLPPMIFPEERGPAPVAGETALNCAGYIRYQRFPKTPQIVGAEQEQEQRVFSHGNYVYINAGSQQGIKQDQQFAIVRPRGELKGVHRQKKGALGIYVQELGRLEVTKVLEHVSLAKIVYACREILLGDLLTEVEPRTSPSERLETSLDRFADPSGKQTGRLMMAQDGHETLTKGGIVFIDLGAEDNIKAGDYLTIYRKLGTGNVTRVDNEEIARGRSRGFQSDRYRGGGFSIQAQRAKDSTAFRNAEGYYRFRPITTREIKRHRPPMPRKIVGEMVILNVQKRTATAIITRVAQEVHTGDFVELQ
jgi:hypothetical protein